MKIDIVLSDKEINNIENVRSQKMVNLLGTKEDEVYAVLNHYDFSTKDIANNLMIPEKEVREYINMVLTKRG